MKNKNILILGGAGRIGSEVSDYLKLSGYNIFIFDKKKNLNFKKQSIICDISKLESFEKQFDLLTKKIKTLKAVINLSYLKNKNWGQHFLKLKSKDVKENLFLQLGTVILTSKKILEFFHQQKHGNLVLFSSIQGLAAPKFNHYKKTNMISPIEYSASKAGIINITKYMAKFCEGKNIKINCISPGGILDKQPKKFIKKYKNSCLSKGLLDAKDLNGVLEFLISDKSNYINGQNLIIDDGWSL